MRFVVISTAILMALAGCAKEPEPETVKRSVVKVTGSDFCEIVCGISRQTGRRDCKIGWSVQDNPKTIDGVVRLAEAVDSRQCVRK